MDTLGIEFWEGPQITLYHTWPLKVVRCGRNFPEHYAYLPTWEHKVLKHTCGCLRHSLQWRRYPCRRDGFVQMWIFCSLPPWANMPCKYPGLEGQTDLQGRMNYFAWIVMEQAERDPEKIRFEVVGQYGVDGPEYFIRVLNGASGPMYQDPGIEWMSPHQVPLFLGHASLEENLESILAMGLRVGGIPGKGKHKRSRQHIHLAPAHPDEEAPRLFRGRDKEVIIWYSTRLMALNGYLFGRCKNGVRVCGSHFAPRLVAGVRRMAVGQWLMAWKGVEPGVDPAVSAASTAHRCPNASSSKDPVTPNVWAQYRQSQPVEEASPPAPQDHMDSLERAHENVVLAATRVEALEEAKSSVVAIWAEPAKLRPCSTLVVHPAQLVKNGILSFEDTMEDTLERSGVRHE